MCIKNYSSKGIYFKNRTILGWFFYCAQFILYLVLIIYYQFIILISPVHNPCRFYIQSFAFHLCFFTYSYTKMAGNVNKNNQSLSPLTKSTIDNQPSPTDPSHLNQSYIAITAKYNLGPKNQHYTTHERKQIKQK